jgi:hypothetical protein
MKGLSNNQLKMIALVSMTIDHVGAYLFPQLQWLRIVGRLAFPIFAYMIAEGCHHTRSMRKYLSTMALFALLCQAVDYFATGSLYMSILVTFTLSICLVFCFQKVEKTKNPLWAVALVLALVTVRYICEQLPLVLKDTDFGVDYGFIGVLLPWALYLVKNKKYRLVMLTVCLIALSMNSYYVQWYSLLAVPLIAFYNGQRGKWNLKWLFYIYYPLHLVVIYGISFLL